MKKQKSALATNSEKSHTSFGLDIRRDSLLEAAFHGRNGIVQEIDYATMNQDLKLRLDMCQDEKEDLAKELKSQAFKAHKADELKLIFNLLDRDNDNILSILDLNWLKSNFGFDTQFGEEVNTLIQEYMEKNVRPKYVKKQVVMDFGAFCSILPKASMLADIRYAFVDRH